MKISKAFDSIDLGQLGDEMSAALGRPVTVQLAEVDAQTVDVEVFEPMGGDVEVTPGLVALVLAHVPRPATVDPLDTLAAALPNVKKLDDLTAALSSYVEGEKAKQPKPPKPPKEPKS
jgi:hypothetical protein